MFARLEAMTEEVLLCHAACLSWRKYFTSAYWWVRVRPPLVSC